MLDMVDNALDGFVTIRLDEDCKVQASSNGTRAKADDLSY